MSGVAKTGRPHKFSGMTDVVLRAATVDDAAALSALDVDIWRASYRRILSKALLDGPTIEFEMQDGSKQFTYSPETDNGPLIGMLLDNQVRIEAQPPDRQGILIASREHVVIVRPHDLVSIADDIVEPPA